MSFVQIMIWFLLGGLAAAVVVGPVPLALLVLAVLAAYAHGCRTRRG